MNQTIDVLLAKRSFPVTSAGAGAGASVGACAAVLDMMFFDGPFSMMPTIILRLIFGS